MQDSGQSSEPSATASTGFRLTPKAARGETSKPTVAPQIGNAWVAHQALGLPSPDALAKKFTREMNPWPAEYRTRDNGVWLYDIESIRSWLFARNPRPV
jgi:hypothetical protein